MASFKRLLFVIVQGKVLDTAFRGENVRQPIGSIISRLAKIGAGGSAIHGRASGTFLLHHLFLDFQSYISRRFRISRMSYTQVVFKMVLILAMLRTQISMMVASLKKHENGIFKATWY